MSQVFFPNEKFDFSTVQPSALGFTVLSQAEKAGTHAYIFKDGVQISHYFKEFNSHKFLNERKTIMLAIFHALSQVVGAHTPWGSLTGIRPSKLVREWLSLDTTDDEIISTLINPFCCSEEKARLAVAVAHAELRVEKKISGTLGLYVSVPFCPTRCVYCSFNTSHKPVDVDFLARYVNALELELREMQGSVSSIYIGGGTPTFLPENLLERLLYSVCENFNNAIEFTVEAGRPETLTADKLRLLAKYGVTRLAINPQTLNDKTLAAIGRGHTAEQFFAAFRLARATGDFCINTDLIAGLPHETADDMRRNMEALAQLAPENITVHTLAVKRASRLNEEIRQGAAYGNENTENMLSVAAEYCGSMGLLPYYLYRQKNMVGLFENVGYARPQYECLYNVGMMAEVQTILGVGAGAVSKFVEGGKITREFNAKNPEIYIERCGEK